MRQKSGPTSSPSERLVNGQRFGVPASGGLGAMCYNLEVFKKAGWQSFGQWLDRCDVRPVDQHRPLLGM